MNEMCVGSVQVCLLQDSEDGLFFFISCCWVLRTVGSTPAFVLDTTGTPDKGTETGWEGEKKVGGEFRFDPHSVTVSHSRRFPR